MTLPDTAVTISEEAVPRYAPPSTATWHVVGMTERGPHDAAISIRSLAEYVSKCGARVAYGSLYDALDVFFREGGSQAYVGRVVGPTPVKASAKLLDQSGSSDPGDVSMIFTAREYGAWANSLNIVADYGTGTVQFTITNDDGDTLETSPVFSTKTDALAWQSAYGTFAAGASSELPRDGSYSLAGGTDDHASAVESNWQDALDLLVPELGPGQVSAPGRTTDTTRQALLAHGLANGRNAFLDTEDTAVVADLVSDAATLRGTDGDKIGAMFGPWAVVPGITAGTTRTVGYSAVQAGLEARKQALGFNENVPAAGIHDGGLGVSRYAIGLSQPDFSAADRETLNDAGICVARQLRGQVTTYGYRTLADPDTHEVWVSLGGSRVAMAIKATFDGIADRFLFSQIDGRGFKISEFGGELAAVCAEYWEAGALYGATIDEAALVDVGPTVNTLESIAAGHLKAKVAIRTSPFAERVEIDIHRVRTADAV